MSPASWAVISHCYATSIVHITCRPGSLTKLNRFSPFRLSQSSRPSFNHLPPNPKPSHLKALKARPQLSALDPISPPTESPSRPISPPKSPQALGPLVPSSHQRSPQICGRMLPLMALHEPLSAALNQLLRFLAYTCLKTKPGSIRDVTYVSGILVIAAAGKSSNGINVVIWDTLVPPSTFRVSIIYHEGFPLTLKLHMVKLAIQWQPQL
ncbi:hypothetical protein I3843_01G117700 [Carya illinoinensis]|nr:hypothetical protein I3843_01G117700 [Carya illinoinensis]